MKNEYKNLLNEMIPNAERFGSRMDLARHQAARMKKVIDAHNVDVDAKTFPSNTRTQTAAEFPTWHEKDVSARARRIQSIAQMQGAKINPRGTPAMSGNTISPNELKLAELDPSDKKPMSTVNFSRLSDEDRQKGQVEADKLRTTGLSDRRVRAGQAAEAARREKITRAFTFESLTQTYINILRETYRITPKRREVLGNIEGRARQDAVDQLTRSPSVMTGSSSMSDQNDFLMNISKISRIEAIKQMGLPQDVRTGRGKGLNDRQLKTVMRNSREAQKNFEYLKQRGPMSEEAAKANDKHGTAARVTLVTKFLEKYPDPKKLTARHLEHFFNHPALFGDNDIANAAAMRKLPVNHRKIIRGMHNDYWASRDW